MLPTKALSSLYYNSVAFLNSFLLISLFSFVCPSFPSFLSSFVHLFLFSYVLFLHSLHFSFFTIYLFSFFPLFLGIFSPLPFFPLFSWSLLSPLFLGFLFFSSSCASLLASVPRESFSRHGRAHYKVSSNVSVKLKSPAEPPC